MKGAVTILAAPMTVPFRMLDVAESAPSMKFLGFFTLKILETAAWVQKKWKSLVGEAGGHFVVAKRANLNRRPYQGSLLDLAHYH